MVCQGGAHKGRKKQKLELVFAQLPLPTNADRFYMLEQLIYLDEELRPSLSPNHHPRPLRGSHTYR